MAHKSHPLPSLSPDDKLLAARISLPASPCVAFAIHRGNYDAIESARRIVLASNSGSTLASSVLVGVETSTDPLLYLFLIAGQEALDTARERLLHFSFDHLTSECSSLDPSTTALNTYPVVENASFAVQDLSKYVLPIQVTIAVKLTETAVLHTRCL
jgi:hypothetical protein